MSDKAHDAQSEPSVYTVLIARINEFMEADGYSSELWEVVGWQMSPDFYERFKAHPATTGDCAIEPYSIPIVRVGGDVDCTLVSRNMRGGV